MAHTDYRVMRQGAQAALVECTLHTGRTHQIRVHLAHLGHPIVGDLAYGKKTQKKSDKFFVKRQLLHAKSLAFELGGKHCDFEAKMPKDFAGFLAEIKEKR